MSKTSLPSMEFTFNLSVKGNETKKFYDGSFTYKRLNIKSQIEASKMEERLKDQLLTLPGDVNLTCQMLSHLRFGLIEFPEWWAKNGYGLELYDTNVITEIYKKISEFEEEWSKKVDNVD